MVCSNVYRMVLKWVTLNKRPVRKFIYVHIFFFSLPTCRLPCFLSNISRSPPFYNVLLSSTLTTSSIHFSFSISSILFYYLSPLPSPPWHLVTLVPATHAFPTIRYSRVQASAIYQPRDKISFRKFQWLERDASILNLSKYKVHLL